MIRPRSSILEIDRWRPCAACGCQFSSFPTSDDGGREALIEAIYQGNGKVAVFIDERPATNRPRPSL